MKTLSLIVPCYNSQPYMRHCMESLIPGDDSVEIIIVNDGSTDDTALVAEEYRHKSPGIVRVVSQTNGGHGAAVNAGIEHAEGVFFKVVDSDDWVDGAAYASILEALSNFAAGEEPDMVISNFVYEKEGKKVKKVMRYANVLPTGRVFTWDDVGKFHKGQYLLMHSIIYRTSLFRSSGLKLPRHTFYVDNLYAYIPLQFVNSMYYLDVDFYRYYIGREGQSVQEETMIKRIDQQLLVNYLMMSGIDLSAVEPSRKREYLFNYLEIVTVVSSILLLRSGTQENVQKKRQLWSHIKSHNKWFYYKLRYGLMGQIINLPGSIGRGISLSAYRLTQMVVGFS